MKRSKVWLVLVLVFLAGFAGGILATRLAVRHFVREAISHPELIRNKIERELDRTVRLTPDQRTQVHAILVDSQQQLQAVRREFQPQFSSVIRETRARISKVLTPEQQERFEKFQAENRALLPVR